MYRHHFLAGSPSFATHCLKTFAQQSSCMRLAWPVFLFENLTMSVIFLIPGYPAFGRLLNATGRPILYGCSWPMFQEVAGIQVGWLEITKKVLRILVVLTPNVAGAFTIKTHVHKQLDPKYLLVSHINICSGWESNLRHLSQQPYSTTHNPPTICMNSSLWP